MGVRFPLGALERHRFFKNIHLLAFRIRQMWQILKGFFGSACGEPQNDVLFLSSLSGLTGQSKISPLSTMLVGAREDSRFRGNDGKGKASS